MTDKSSKRPRTILDMPAEPVSKEEREKAAEQWATECLGTIWYLSIGNKNIARKLCETATITAINDDELINLIKNNLRKKRGRPTKWSPEINKILLMHYAHAIFESEDVNKKLNESVCLQQGNLLSNESLENKISDAINDIRSGKLTLNEFPDWAQPIIESRMDKGEKTRKCTKKYQKIRL